MIKKFLLVVLLFALGAPSQAQTVPEAARTDLPPPEPAARSWVLMDFNTGWILAEHQSDEKIEPASLTKLMTAYVTFDELTKGSIKLDDKVHVSKKAWQTGVDTFERTSAGNRMTRAYDDGFRQFLLVFDPPEEAAELRLSAIYLP